MAGFFHPRLLVFVVAAGAGAAGWYLAPVTGVERLAFSAVMGGYATPRFFLSGKGSHDDPWSVRTLSVKPRIDSRKAPVVVSIGDDPGGVFQSSPPSPVDLAVVLKNLQRLGARQAAIAAVMAWEKPDPVSLKGLEIVLNDFQMVIHAAPLARGTVRQPLPPALRRASLAAESIRGDVSKLPIVNRVAVPDVIFSGERALAGFTLLDDADAGNGALPLLARWEEEDRVVLAFPLLAVLARYDLPVAGIRVKLGEFLQLGPSGPVVPIDSDGRMALPPKPLAARADVSAEALIDGTPAIFPASPGLIVLRDDQSAAPRATREFSANLASVIASIGSDAGLGPACAYRRLTAAWELSLLMAGAGLLALFAGGSGFQRLLGCGVLAAVCAAAQWLAVGLAQTWLPGIPLLIAILAGAAAMLLLGEEPVLVKSLVVLPVVPPPRAPAPQVAVGRKRTFRSDTMRKEPARGHWPVAAVPSSMEHPPEVPEPAPFVPEPTAFVEQPAAPVEEPAALVAEPVAPVEEPAALVAEPAAPVEAPGSLFEELETSTRKANGRKGATRKAAPKKARAGESPAAANAPDKPAAKRSAARKAKSSKVSGGTSSPPESAPPES